MTIIGYARVSAADQDCSMQEAALKSAGCEIVRSEKRSGTKLEGRNELEAILVFIREGDTLVVTRIDRLARSLADLCRVAAKQRSAVCTRAASRPCQWLRSGAWRPRG